MEQPFRIFMPDGSLEKVVHDLFAEAGIRIAYGNERSYRGRVIGSSLFNDVDHQVIKMRPWDMPQQIKLGRGDLAITGGDLIIEAKCQQDVEQVDHYPLSRGGQGWTQVVFAVPKESEIKELADIRNHHEVVTEYPNTAKHFLHHAGVHPVIVPVHGKTEAHRDLADVICDNTETGRSLEVGGFRIIYRTPKSMVTLIASKQAMQDPQKRELIKKVQLLLRAVMDARPLRLLKFNVLNGNLDMVIKLLPAGSTPTVNDLAGDAGHALEVVLSKGEVNTLIPKLAAAGASRIVELDLHKFVP